MRTPVIVDAVRTPMGRGKHGGALSEIHPTDLLAGVLRALVERNALDPGTIDDVIVGCVSQVGEQAGTPGRMALLAAGFPVHVPSTTIDRKCGSSQQAIHFAAQGIMAGVYDIVIAGGVESMSRVPMGSARIGKEPLRSGGDRPLCARLGPQGISAELVAARWHLSREQLDAYSAASHRRAAAVQAAGGFAREIVPVCEGERRIDTDETIRPSTTFEALSQLKTSFTNDAIAARFPEIGWRITAGNSSQITDGAAALLLMTEESALRLGLRRVPA
jgi:acetyl-CoA acyltransferase